MVVFDIAHARDCICTRPWFDGWKWKGQGVVQTQVTAAVITFGVSGVKYCSVSRLAAAASARPNGGGHACLCALVRYNAKQRVLVRYRCHVGIERCHREQQCAPLRVVRLSVF